MNHLIKAYIKFFFKAKNEHGVHSPFVFDLVTKCFYDKTNYPEYEILKNYRNSLLNNKNTIKVTDFGAGSRVFKSNTREISAIAKNAGISIKNAKLLFRIVRYFQPEQILEIGTSLGLATSALASGNSNAKITTLEGCPNTIKQTQLELKKININSIDFVNTEFSTYFKSSDFRLSTFNLIYFDGNHSKKATLDYFNMLLPTISNDTIWIFDDIHWSQDMEEAWTEIKNHPKVTVTIDTFQWGIVFFRKEQAKEHFVINPKRNFSSKFFEKTRIKM
ncbi:O-methyltransferase [Flavobacterium okayamense]|uniref:O-methyltransferase n=1 Tax=Flavobacterium okayamense TaxID=2830782 RepID=A0ABM7S4Y6_9FLAO|nr:class I SAM-dependent methyltransferase [Flavobacterium okayamense]BCY28542.1 O-methyltransferase [Flavobacterium okayamense]